MGRVAVRTCDACDAWDSADVVVRKIGVAGPRFDLCAKCRIGMIAKMTGDVDSAEQYVIESDARWLAKGQPDSDQEAETESE